MNAPAQLAMPLQQPAPFANPELAQPSPTREEVLARYRRYRHVRTGQQTAALAKVSLPSLMRHAHRLGMLQGKNTILADNPDDIHLIYDLAVHTAAPGASRAIDRYARTARPAPGTDEARVLSALQGAWFSIFMVEERHPVAGLVLFDLMRGTRQWLMDEGMEASLPDGEIIATRICQPDDFAMGCGAFVPIDRETMIEVIGFLTGNAFDANLATLADHPRFAASVYRLALDFGLTETVRYADPRDALG